MQPSRYLLVYVMCLLACHLHNAKSTDIERKGLHFSRNVSHIIMQTTIQTNPPARSCINQEDLQEFEKYAVEEAVRMARSEISVVSLSRLVTTLWLARAAMTLDAGGHFVETGVYKGGTSILLINSLLKFDTCNRNFWGYDSFEGLPAITAADKRGNRAVGAKGEFSSTEAVFYQNLKYFSADTKPHILHITKGYFIDTLPKTPLKSIAFLRLDGDIYTSTWDALTFLYPKVVPGGYIYVDDYASFNGCKRAVDNYRLQHSITEPLVSVYEGRRPPNRRGWREHEASWWKKGSAGSKNDEPGPVTY